MCSWASLCQACKAPDGRDIVDRTAEEREAFRRAIESMQLWYAHQKLFAILLTTLPDGCTAPTYDERGWPNVERAWTMLAKPNNLSCWPMIYEVGPASGEAHRTPPMHPDRLASLLQTKRFTSPKADRPLVIRLYRETMAAVLGEASKLSFGEAGWTDDDVTGLAEVLPICGRCLKLNLGRNAFGDVGAAALASGARDGALMSLTVLALNDNAIGDAGLTAIARAAAAGAFPGLRHLFLMNNRVGAAGCVALAAALRERALPELKELRLSGNPDATGIDGKPLCHFWAKGKCTKGDGCAFRHGTPAEKPQAWSELERACAERKKPKLVLWRDVEAGGAGLAED